MTNRYLLIIRNEENFAEKTTVSFNYAKLIVVGFGLFIVITALSFFLVTTVLSQWFDPRHAQQQVKSQMVEFDLKLDSIEQEMNKKDLLISRFQKLLAGDTLETQTELSERSSTDKSEKKDRDLDETEMASIDSAFRKKFSSVNNAILTSMVDDGEGSELQEIVFFPPLKGLVSSKYNPIDNHYGIDVVAVSNDPVKCVADGTVIFSDWSQDGGYTVAVQHVGNLISVYKHNSALLKQTGNFIRGGDVIALVGNSGELTDGPHLHFELWYNGNSVNPEEFVSF
ncbi:M23 family metallopeptidase [Flammeovirgaceae bacterium KN852]|uniref:M23 family metallopeptidase n=1 Tax=Marinigracilibium pacificum TaxID=2729599 RepID=A0A848ITT3_9BACT|nr:M23 family metallopeptidase [Marinigracilibium pacificum]